MQDGADAKKKFQTAGNFNYQELDKKNGGLAPLQPSMNGHECQPLCANHAGARA